MKFNNDCLSKAQVFFIRCQNMVRCAPCMHLWLLPVTPLSRFYIISYDSVIVAFENLELQHFARWPCLNWLSCERRGLYWYPYSLFNGELRNCYEFPNHMICCSSNISCDMFLFHGSQQAAHTRGWFATRWVLKAKCDLAWSPWVTQDQTKIETLESAWT